MQKSIPQRFVFQIGQSFDQIFFQELRGAAGSLDGQLDVRFRQRIGEVRSRRDHDIGGLVLDDDDAPDAIFDRRVFALCVNAHVDGASVSQRVVLVDAELADEKELALDGGLEEAEIDGGARPELGEVEF